MGGWAHVEGDGGERSLGTSTVATVWAMSDNSGAGVRPEFAMKPTPLNLVLAALTLIGGLILTGIGVSQAYEHTQDEARFQFDRLAERLSAAIQRRMNQPVYGLKGARGIYAVSQSVEQLEFRI